MRDAELNGTTEHRACRGRGRVGPSPAILGAASRSALNEEGSHRDRHADGLCRVYGDVADAEADYQLVKDGGGPSARWHGKRRRG